MDYREYRKKYGSSGSSSSGNGKSNDLQRGRLPDYSENSRGLANESQTGSVTRHFTTNKPRTKKRRGAQSKNSAQAKIVLGSIIALTFVLILTSVLLIFTSGSVDIPDCLARKVIVEAGRTSIKASDFLKDKSHTAEFEGDSNFKLDSIGKYSVRLSVDGEGPYTVVLEVRDTVAPTAKAKTITIRKGRTPKAMSCVTNVQDATNVTAAFSGETDFSNIGRYTVNVVLTDEAGNESVIQSTVNVVEDADILVDEVEIEAGSDRPGIFEFVGEDGYGKFATDTSIVDTSVPGRYKLEINVQGKLYPVYVKVVDTVAPVGTVVALNYYNLNIPDPMDFFKQIKDETEVTASYATEPNWNSQGTVNVKLILCDAGGNRSEYETTATHLEDYEAPTILLLKSYLECNIGDTVISWSKLVATSDNSGEEVTVIFDKGNADFAHAGTYTVWFTATDKAGNEKKISTTLEVRDLDISEQRLMDECIKPIIDEIITPGMTGVQKAKAIYTYLNGSKADRLKYKDTSEHDDWIKQAWIALKGDRKGDCFVFAAVANACFRYLGYDTVMVERSATAQIAAGGTHWWVMVNFGTDAAPSWYHFDATPQMSPFRGENLYMMTTAQTETFSKYRYWYLKTYANKDRNEYWYDYDQSKYPTSATNVVVEFTSSYYKKYKAAK